MGKYGKWWGRQKLRKDGKISGIFLFVCIYLCPRAPSTVETHAKKRPACLQGAPGFSGSDGFA
eukprot:9500261-Pyramimonas_sp.AAC.1